MSSEPHEPTSPDIDRTTAITSMLDVFSDADRRFILYCLQEADGPVDVAEIRTRLADWSSDGVDSAVAESCHNHVLEMEAFGVVEYDRGNDAVRIADDVALSVQRPTSPT